METATCTMHCAVWSDLALLQSRVRFQTSMTTTLNNGNGAVHDALRRVVWACLIAISCPFSNEYEDNLNNGNGAVHDALRRLVWPCLIAISCPFSNEYENNLE